MLLLVHARLFILILLDGDQKSTFAAHTIGRLQPLTSILERREGECDVVFPMPRRTPVAGHPIDFAASRLFAQNVSREALRLHSRCNTFRLVAGSLATLNTVPV